MGKSLSALTAIAVTAALCACATTETDKSEKVKIYSPAELRQGEYEQKAWLWVESWRTVSWVPSYSTREDGIAALKDKAKSFGANGLTNVDCYGDSGLFGGATSYTCYGKAIKVR